MRCAEVQNILSQLLYADLTPDQRQGVEEHLGSCPKCQVEFAGLKNLKGLLDQLPVPLVRVDVAQIYRESQMRQERRARRWRRAAMALTGIAALLALAMVLKMEIRADGKQLVLTWGAAAVEAPANQAAPPSQVASAPGEATNEKRDVTKDDLNLMRDLIHALAADADNRDHRLQESLAGLENQLARMDRQAQERWAATVRYVAATTLAENQEGENP